MDDLAAALHEAGGTGAPRERGAQLRDLLRRDLERGAAELDLPRSGRAHPVRVALAGDDGGGLLAATPAPAALKADPDAAPERAWLLVAATVGALADAAGLPAPHAARDLALRTAELHGRLVLLLPTAPGTAPDAELAALAFEDHAQGIDRLRAEALALPAHVVAGAGKDARPPIGATHPLRVAEAVARLGGHPADPADGDRLEDAVLALLGGAATVSRPHDDPDPARRVARRILQRLDGMGKWGGYHTEFAHLARGFAGNDRALAEQVGEALLAARLLDEKPSVGQRHVFLNPRRAGDIRRLIERGDAPADLTLP